MFIMFIFLILAKYQMPCYSLKERLLLFDDDDNDDA